MEFWYIVLAVVLGLMIFRIGVNIGRKGVMKPINDVTHITLKVPYGVLDEDKLDLNEVNSLYYSKEENVYDIELATKVGRLTTSQLEEIKKRYNAISVQADYVTV